LYTLQLIKEAKKGLASLLDRTYNTTEQLYQSSVHRLQRLYCNLILYIKLATKINMK